MEETSKYISGIRSTESWKWFRTFHFISLIFFRQQKRKEERYHFNIFHYELSLAQKSAYFSYWLGYLSSLLINTRVFHITKKYALLLFRYWRRQRLLFCWHLSLSLASTKNEGKMKEAFFLRLICYCSCMYS